jgi:hypothetical protein
MTKDQESLALLKAVNAALENDWDGAHVVAQDSEHPAAHWLHAVLHKIEGDAGNSRYWYARAGKRYEDFADTASELKAIAALLEETGI